MRRRYGEAVEDSEESEEAEIDPILDFQAATDQYNERMVQALTPYDTEHFKIADFVEEVKGFETQEDVDKWTNKVTREELMIDATPDQVVMINRMFPEAKELPEERQASKNPEGGEDFIDFEEDSMFNPVIEDQPK